MIAYLFIYLNLFRLFIYLFIQALAEAKKRIEELEKKILENVPIDTAKEIGAYQEKMVSANVAFIAIILIVFHVVLLCSLHRTLSS